MPVTLKDIAKECQLAVSTVSNILNGNKTSYASQKAKDLVKKTAKDLGYKRDYLSMSLRTKKTQSIGLCVEHLNDETRSSFVTSFVHAFNEMGYDVSINVHHSDPGRAIAAIKSFDERYKDGIIFFTDFLKDIGPQRDEIIKTINSIDVKLLGIGSELQGEIPCLDIKRTWAFDHLLDLYKNKKILIVYKTPAEFREGFLKFNSQEITHFSDVYTFDDFKTKWNKLPLDQKQFDGVFFRTDNIAIPALKFFAQEGIKVPNDLRVIGFDNFKFSEFTTPALTTYAINFDQLASLAFCQLTDWITGKIDLKKDYYETILPTFISRASHDTTKI